jgi:H+/Cl- antiporter ClcA
MMKHGKHLYLMVGLVVLAVVLSLAGVGGGGWVPFLFIGGCVVMMFFMMRGMGGGQHGRDGHDEPEDESSQTPPHDRHG